MTEIADNGVVAQGVTQTGQEVTLAVAQALGEDLADCCAIGDSANDLEMLQCVGHPLVMGNAPARVQAVAEYVTGTPAEDGLYHAMVHAGLLTE